MHLGLIGGIGPAATEFYYRGLVRAHGEANIPMELTLEHAHLPELIQNMNANAPQLQAQVFLRLAQRLHAAGAEVVAVTSMAGHFCIREFERISPLPIINAVAVLQAELVHRKLWRVGLLGTRVVMASRLYGMSDIEVVVPAGECFTATHDNYVALAASGYATEQQRALFFAVGRELYDNKNVDAVVLGGTDLFLAFDGYDSGFPVIDSAQVHINALARASLNSTSAREE